LDLLHKEADVRLRLMEQKELPRKVKRVQHRGGGGGVSGGGGAGGGG